jgi:colanic acid biosynthesis glycosyl transferase WcaI
MRILIVSNLYSPEPTGIGVYSGGMAESLAALGHEVKVVAANPSYPHWKLYDGFPAWRWSMRRENGVDVYRCPVYIPSKVSGLRRILHYSSFGLAALVPLLKLALGWKPHLIFHAVPTILASPSAMLAATLGGSKTWLHVQDYEVEAGFATGQMRGDNYLAKLALSFERKMVGAYDIVSAISPEMCRKLVEKGRNPESVYELRNWSDIQKITPLENSSYRKRWNITTKHVALYSGAIAQKQGIEVILQAARALQHRDDLTFVMCGAGPERPALEESARDLKNLQFHDLQPVESLGDLLALATVHLLPQKAGAADLMLPSKLTNMLASGRPVVATAASGTGLAREVEGCGVVTPPGDLNAFTRGIEQLIDDPQLRDTLALAARARAEEVWDRKRILERFVDRVSLIIEDRPPPAAGLDRVPVAE